MPNGRRGNGNNGPRRMGGKHRGRSRALQTKIDTVVNRMQQSPHVRFILPEKEMRRAIDEVLFRREFVRRMKKIPSWKKIFLQEAHHAREMNYDSVVKKLEELDNTIKPVYRRLNESQMKMLDSARRSMKINSTFIKAARSFMVMAYNIAQMEQHRLAYEMVQTIYERSRADPQIILAFEKGSRERGRDESEAQRHLSNELGFMKWCQKEFARLKKL